MIDFNSMQAKSEMNMYSSNVNTSGSPNTSSEGASVMPASSAPPVPKPVVRRRVRRRANSSSQDPAEQLTEMSVRGRQLTRINPDVTSF